MKPINAIQPPSAPAPPPAASPNTSASPGAQACPCGFPIRRIYAGELICANCGRRETLAREFWAAVARAMVGGLTYGRHVNGVRGKLVSEGS